MLLDGIQAVTFDVGGTLIDPWPSVGHIYAEVAFRHGWNAIDPDLLNRQFAAAWKTKSNFDYSKLAWAELVAKTFQRTHSSEKIPFFDTLYERFTRAEAWRIYPDVLPTLHELQQRGIPLAVVSNWDDRLPPLLQNLRLDRFFQVLAVSYRAGAPKPSPRIFHDAARRLRILPSAILHVGDSYREDVEGAQAAGFKAVLLARALDSSGPGAIRSLEQIL